MKHLNHFYTQNMVRKLLASSHQFGSVVSGAGALEELAEEAPWATPPGSRSQGHAPGVTPQGHAPRVTLPGSKVHGRRRRRAALGAEHDVPGQRRGREGCTPLEPCVDTKGHCS